MSPLGYGIRDGRAYGPYGQGYVDDDHGHVYPIGPGGVVLPQEYDFQPGSGESYASSWSTGWSPYPAQVPDLEPAGFMDGRGYGPYDRGYLRDASGRWLPIGPDGGLLPPEYDFQPGLEGSYMPLRRPLRWLPHLGPDPGPEAFGVCPPAGSFRPVLRRGRWCGVAR